MGVRACVVKVWRSVEVVSDADTANLAGGGLLDLVGVGHVGGCAVFRLFDYVLLLAVVCRAEPGGPVAVLVLLCGGCACVVRVAVAGVVASV